MSERVVTVVGAGNMRTGPAVMATVSRWYPDVPFSVRLFDANSERLDLMDLLLRQVLDSWNDEVPAIATQDLGEALDGTTDLVLTIHEDCARRMMGRGSSEALEYFEGADEMDMYLGGDRNKPTPVAHLSEQTRRLLESPKQQGNLRGDVILQAVEDVLQKVGEGVRVVSLVRDVSIESFEGVEHFDWPPAVDEAQLTLVPHQILRWVRGDEEIGALAEVADRSPLMAWLKNSEAG